MNLLSLRTLIGSTYVELKLHKKLFQKLSITKIKALRKWKKLSSNSTNQNKQPFKFTSFSFNSNFLEGNQTLNPDVWHKTLTDLFKKCSDGYFLTAKNIAWAMYQIFCVPDVKTSLTLSVTLSVILSISLSTTTEQSSKETFLKI